MPLPIHLHSQLWHRCPHVASTIYDTVLTHHVLDKVPKTIKISIHCLDWMILYQKVYLYRSLEQIKPLLAREEPAVRGQVSRIGSSNILWVRRCRSLLHIKVYWRKGSVPRLGSVAQVAYLLAICELVYFIAILKAEQLLPYKIQ
jgi:hypothetical protein